MSQILFFATRNDLLPLLAAAEEDHEIKYVRFGASNTRSADSLLSGAAIPGLGRATNESSMGCDTFLVCDRSEVIRPRQVGPRYLFDQLVNPDTITFTPGGLWGEDILLHGRFATASTSKVSLDLIKVFRSLIRKHFKKIRAFYVGSEAGQLLDEGKRLTIAAQSPRTVDLARA